MIVLIDTSTPLCKLTFIDGDWRYDASWEARRELATGLLAYLERELQGQGKVFRDIAALGAFRGPGSFTGLRIGLTVFNTLADALAVPIVGEVEEDWQEKILTRLQRGENERIVLPFYGGEAHITLPRK